MANKSINDSLAFSFTTMTANLQRLSVSESLEVLGFLKQLELDIVTTLYDNPEMSSYKKSRYDALLTQTRNTIATAYTKIDSHHEEFKIATAGTIEAGTKKNFSTIGLPLYSVALTEEQLKSLASNSLIKGAPSKDWWAKQSQSLQDSFSEQMRIGYASGESVSELVKRVRGSSTGNKKNYIVDGKKKTYTEYRGGIMDASRKDAESLVRTSTQQIAADAKLQVFRDNDDVIRGVGWGATLDLKTTMMCAARDGKEWDLNGKPIGHSLSSLGFPPAHWNCRSVLYPITYSFEELGMKGLDESYLNSIGEGTRASMNGQVPSTMTFDSWFSSLSVNDQKSYLGNTKYTIWKENGLSFSDMTNQQGNPLTLRQLADSYDYSLPQQVSNTLSALSESLPPAVVVVQTQLAEQLTNELEQSQNLKSSLEDVIVFEVGKTEVVLDNKTYNLTDAAQYSQYKNVFNELIVQYIDNVKTGAKHTKAQKQAYNQLNPFMKQVIDDLIKQILS